ncbi:DUF2637 domain-containing protein [Frankia sp. CNm7]|uniref:DUF2637 domain-containing protein n=1 Tax=Frankia nepalensis TaxID=1836974 RepID=A0A937RSL3_9ACTN|nr:DUF2637 domain-containing protein [Frankia nepalensis]MBL7499776.1 DUF2637 domain-containing protein [Frankia nepalensis]MBL7512261.1 DUF2637 domain-containing protein [Frankia nepalensis]MBL7520454.1 DUF2637 domain-containing protein [Frankia nepalensis]MBL7632589.1 DUF2637 domain-containing protein [Frankia nepalensis]
MTASPTTRPRPDRSVAAQARPAGSNAVRPGAGRSVAGPRAAADPDGAADLIPTRPAGAAPTATTTDTSAVPTAGPRDLAALPTVGGPRGSRWGSGELWIRLATVIAVVTVALIAGAVSYLHMSGVAREHGEDRLTAAIVPISVDGLIVAASLTLLADSRAGRRRSPLPYALLVLASAASVAANVMHAEPDLAARVIAAWPSAALIGAYEMLVSQIRRARPRPADTARPRRPGPDGTPSSIPNGDAPADPGRNDVEGLHADSQEHLHGQRHTEPPAAAECVDRPAVSGSPSRVSVPQTETGPCLWLPEDDVPWPADAAEWAAAPEPIPPAVLTWALRTARRGSKRARLAATLLRDIAPDDPRTDYALARDLAPVVDLHAGTARRYLSEWRRQATSQPTAA